MKTCTACGQKLSPTYIVVNVARDFPQYVAGVFCDAACLASAVAYRAFETAIAKRS